MSDTLTAEFLQTKLGAYPEATHWPAARSVQFFSPSNEVRPVCKCGWESRITMSGKGSIDRAIRYAYERHIDILDVILA